MVNAGATWLDRDVVADGRLVTSRGPQDLATFVPAIIDLFSGKGVPETIPRGATSSPQRNEPPQLVISAMKWLPRPSIRTALGLGAVALVGAAVLRQDAATPARRP